VCIPGEGLDSSIGQDRSTGAIGGRFGKALLNDIPRAHHRVPKGSTGAGLGWGGKAFGKVSVVWRSARLSVRLTGKNTAGRVTAAGHLEVPAHSWRHSPGS